METQVITTETKNLPFVPSKAGEIETFKLKLSAIKQVTNDTELEEASNIIKQSKQAFKEIEAERKSFTVKLDAIKAESMKFEKELKAAFDPVDALTTAYLRKKELERQQELKRIEEEQRKKAFEAAEKQRLQNQQEQNVIKYELNGKEAIASANDLNKLDVVKAQISNYKISEQTFGQHIDKAYEISKELLHLIEIRRNEIITKKETTIINIESVEQKLSQSEIESTLKEAEVLQQVDLETQARAQSLGTTSGIRKVWTFELEDISKVPAELLLIDTTKVNALIKGGTRSIPGLRIFQDVTRSGK